MATVRELGTLVAQADAIRERSRARASYDLPCSEPGYGWKAQASEDGSVLELDIMDVIEEWYAVSPSEIVAALRESNAKTIRVNMNSPGGVATDGVAIYNALAEHPAKVEITVLGMAASAASYIFQAGDVRMMGAGAMVMVHNPWSIVIGEAADMRAQADILDKIAESFGGILQARSGQTAEQITQWLDAETWFTAAEAVDAGLADEVIPAKTSSGAKDEGPGDGGRARARLDTTSLINALRGVR